MSKQPNCSPKPAARPAASGSSAVTAKKSEGKPISNGGSVFGAKVGPKDAPYLQK